MSFQKIKSYAKINLVLNIIGKDSSLHKIESIIMFAALHDEISIKMIKSDKHNITSQRLIEPNQIWGFGEKYNRNDQLNWIKICRKPIYWIPKID